MARLAVKISDCTPVPFKDVGINQPFISNEASPVCVKIMSSFYTKMGPEAKDGSLPWSDPKQEVYLLPT